MAGTKAKAGGPVINSKARFWNVALFEALLVLIFSSAGNSPIRTVHMTRYLCPS